MRMRQPQEDKTSRHNFITGNLVLLSKRYPPRKATPGPYKVVSQLPERNGQFEYRIKSGFEPFYRTVAESELEPHLEQEMLVVASPLSSLGSRASTSLELVKRKQSCDRGNHRSKR